MRFECGHVLPVFNKHEARRVFTIHRDIMGDTARLCARSLNMDQAEITHGSFLPGGGNDDPDNNDHNRSPMTSRFTATSCGL